MKKLGLTLLLSCFVFLFSFSPVFATEITESVDSLSSTDSIFPLEVGDVLPAGSYVFNDVISFDSFFVTYDSNVYYLDLSYYCDGYLCTYVYFERLSDKSGFFFNFRPEFSTVYRSYSVDGNTPGWLSSSYRYITINEPITVNSINVDFFNNLTEYRFTEKAVDFLDTIDVVFDGFLLLFDSIVLAFWIPNEGLTFIGVLAVISLCIAISFLIFAVICRFLKFRG